MFKRLLKELLAGILVTTALLLLNVTFVQADNTEPWKGYVDSWGNEVPGLITNDYWMSPMPEYVSGKAVFYGPYAMDATAEYRGIDYEQEGCIGGVSLMSPYDIGEKAWVKIDGFWHGPYCVVDCAKRGDMYSVVVYREEIIELPFELAQEVGMVGALQSELVNHRYYEVYDWYKYVEVLVGKSPFTYNFSEKPIVYKNYFLENIEFATGYEPRVLELGSGIWKEYGTEKYWIKEEKDIIDDNQWGFLNNLIGVCYVEITT